MHCLLIDGRATASIKDLSNDETTDFGPIIPFCHASSLIPIHGQTDAFQWVLDSGMVAEFCSTSPGQAITCPSLGGFLGVKSLARIACGILYPGQKSVLIVRFQPIRYSEVTLNFPMA